MRHRWCIVVSAGTTVVGLLVGAVLAGGRLQLVITTTDLETLAKVLGSAATIVGTAASIWRYLRHRRRRRRKRQHDAERAKAELARLLAERAIREQLQGTEPPEV